MMFLCYAFISLLTIAENYTQRRKNTKMNKKTCMQMNKNWQKDFFPRIQFLSSSLFSSLVQRAELELVMDIKSGLHTQSL